MSGQQEIDINQLPHVILFVSPTGQVAIDTNMNNKIQLYGLLELGKEMIQDKFAKKSDIVAAPASALGILDK